MNQRVSLALALSLSLCTSALHATTRTWTGTTNGNWSVGTNWGGTAPAAGDDLVFPEVSNKTTTNDFAAYTSFNSIFFTAGGYTVSGNGIMVVASIASQSGTSATPNTINAPVRLGATQGFTSITGRLVFNAIDLNGFNITFGGASETRVTGTISGAGTIMKNGAGTLLLLTGNTYTGTTTVAGGTLELSSFGRLGATTAGTTVMSGATLHLVSIGSLAEPLQLSGTGVGGLGALTIDDIVTLTNNVSISGTTRIRTNGSVTFAGIVDGAGTFDFASGTVVFANSGNAFNADIGWSTASGTLRVDADGVFPATTSVTIPAGVTFNLNNHTATIEGVDGSGTVDLGSGILTIAGPSTHSFDGSMTGSGGLNIRDGSQALSGGGITFSGQTDIYAPGFAIFSATNAGNIVVHTHGALDISGAADSGTITSLGGSIFTGGYGEMSEASCHGLYLDGTSAYYQTVNGTTIGLYGRLSVNGTVTLGNATLLFTSSAVMPSTTLTIIDNLSASPTNDTFFALPNGAVAVGEGKLFRIAYDGGDGNDVTITQLPARGDTSADLKGDIVWRNGSTGSNSQWIMDGPAVSSYALPAVADTNWKIAGIGDLNGDGKADYVWRNDASGANVVWFMDGGSVSSSAALTPVPDTNWKIAGVADFSGDYKADILWRHSATGSNAMWLMDGATITSSAALPRVADTNFHIAGIGDLQGDGKADVIWRNVVTGTNVGWLMNGGTVAASGLLTAVPDLNWTIAGVGDFQRDGKADIFWRNTASGSNSVWLMSGLAIAASGASTPVPDTNWTIVKVEDLQGDSKADLVWRNVVSGANSVWFMNGMTPAVTASLTTVPDLNWSPGGTP